MSLAFHRFPSDAERCKLWQFEIRRDVASNFKITSNTRVCSSHFKQDDYVGKLLSGEEPERKRLNPTAVPTQFQWTATPKPARRVLKRKRQESEEPQDIDDAGVVSVVSGVCSAIDPAPTPGPVQGLPCDHRYISVSDPSEVDDHMAGLEKRLQ